VKEEDGGKPPAGSIFMVIISDGAESLAQTTQTNTPEFSDSR
jgi:hypothetical protein